MQGRLVAPEEKKIQSFPWKNWRKEFQIANKIGLSLIEWTIDRNKFFLNPINLKKGRDEINYLKKKYNIKIDYLELRNTKNLQLTNRIKNAKIFVAYYINKVRLIDNY